MDKKAKKRVEVLNKKVRDLQQRLNGAKQQCDDPDEVVQLEKQIADATAPLELDSEMSGMWRKRTACPSISSASASTAPSSRSALRSVLRR